MSLIKPEKSTRYDMKALPSKRKVMLQLTSMGKNSNKFYYIELFDVGAGNGLVFTRYGRTGDRGVEDYRHADYARCEKEVEWLMKNKTKKGYAEVETVDTAPPQTVAATTTKKPTTTSSNLPPNVVDFITFMFGNTSGYIRENVRTPLGKLTESQIKKGRAILDEISKTDPQASNFVELHDAYYTAIPQNLGRRLGQYHLIDDPKKVSTQEDLLQALADLIGVQDAALGDDVEERYRKLGAKIDAVGQNEWKELEDWFKNSRSANHRVDATILDILKVDRNETYDSKLAAICEEQAFHGTKTQNILGICSRGLLLPGQHSASTTGAMFGRGIYGAIHSTKSMQYCGSSWRSSGVQYMFVMDMAMGNYLTCNSWGDYRGTSDCPRGYDSVWAKAGRSLQHDELIVYNTNQARLRYIIKFKSGWR